MEEDKDGAWRMNFEVDTTDNSGRDGVNREELIDESESEEESEMEEETSDSDNE